MQQKWPTSGSVLSTFAVPIGRRRHRFPFPEFEQGAHFVNTHTLLRARRRLFLNRSCLTNSSSTSSSSRATQRDGNGRRPGPQRIPLITPFVKTLPMDRDWTFCENLNEIMKHAPHTHATCEYVMASPICVSYYIPVHIHMYVRMGMGDNHSRMKTQGEWVPK